MKTLNTYPLNYKGYLININSSQTLTTFLRFEEGTYLYPQCVYYKSLSSIKKAIDKNIEVYGAIP